MQECVCGMLECATLFREIITIASPAAYIRIYVTPYRISPSQPVHERCKIVRFKGGLVHKFGWIRCEQNMFV